MSLDKFQKQAKKAGNWLLKDVEQKIKSYLVPKIPPQIETYHLTCMTLFWIILAIVGGYLAEKNLNYLCLISVAIIGQYFTDLLDGELGRYRNTGLVKWGFYFDHILDFGFLCSILVGYWFVAPPDYHYIILATLILSGAYFVHTILFFGATGQFEISTLGIGPPEIRLVLVIINTTLALFDKVLFVNFLKLYFFANVIFLIFAVYTTQKRLWAMDMAKKAKSF